MDDDQSAQFAITKFKPADLDTLVRLDTRLFGPDGFSRTVFKQFVRQPHSIFWVAWSGSTLAGYIVATLMGRTGYVASIAVDIPFQRQGLARRLLAGVHEVYRQRGAVEIKLHVRAGNAPAIALYRKLGYEIEKTIPRYYADKAPALLMRLVLES
jgi:[ribosomal protein S18]-alanine N-acetyltransferase